MPSVEEYVDSVCTGLNMPDETRRIIREELLSHAREAISEKVAAGHGRAEAVSETLTESGDATEIRENYIVAYKRRHVVRVLGRMAGLAVFLALLGAACFGNGAAFWDWGSALFVIGGGTCLLFGACSPKAVWRAWTLPFRSHALNDGELSYAAQVLKTWAALSLGCGFLAAVLGTFMACSMSNDPAALGPALCLAILGLLYGVCFAGMLWTAAESLPAGSSEIMPPESRGLGSFVAIGVFVLIVLSVMASRGMGLNRWTELADIPSLVFVVLGVAALIVATHGFQGVRRIASFVPSDQEPSCVRSRLRTIGFYFGVVGLIGFLIGAVLILSCLNDLTQLPQATAVALLTLLYGASFGLFCWVGAGIGVDGASVESSAGRAGYMLS